MEASGKNGGNLKLKQLSDRLDVVIGTLTDDGTGGDDAVVLKLLKDESSDRVPKDDVHTSDSVWASQSIVSEKSFALAALARTVKNATNNSQNLSSIELIS